MEGLLTKDPCLTQGVSLRRQSWTHQCDRRSMTLPLSTGKGPGDSCRWEVVIVTRQQRNGQVTPQAQRHPLLTAGVNRCLHLTEAAPAPMRPPAQDRRGSRSSTGPRADGGSEPAPQ
jgi:hypothetical protein